MQWYWLTIVQKGAYVKGNKLWYPLTNGTLRSLMEWYLDHVGMIDSVWWVSTTFSNHLYSHLQFLEKWEFEGEEVPVRWWYWHKIIAVLVIDGMDCQIVTRNICLGELHNNLPNPMTVRRCSIGAGILVNVVFGNNCEHILFQTSWCKNLIYVILVDAQLR